MQRQCERVAHFLWCSLLTVEAVVPEPVASIEGCCMKTTGMTSPGLTESGILTFMAALPLLCLKADPCTNMTVMPSPGAKPWGTATSNCWWEMGCRTLIGVPGFQSVGILAIVTCSDVSWVWPAIADPLRAVAAQTLQEWVAAVSQNT
eukprot:CAMPEP_0171082010 /NCGR_PEP_ID=MMETSP0766_2-20121228/16845_1 /TAXON_ID=439317 /ORGANISM="Gambierdiscus australes, Strain CAWD 149" /LENGTH=147 /DNA_ID=CAMNT_0011539347 /DNA_START=94 /DNA_END=535 /DNA_ORIENTATION=+